MGVWLYCLTATPPVLAGWPRLHIKPSLTPGSQSKLPLALEDDGYSFLCRVVRPLLCPSLPSTLLCLWNLANLKFPHWTTCFIQQIAEFWVWRGPRQLLHLVGCYHYSLTLKRTTVLPATRRGRWLQFILVLDWLAWISALFRCDAPGTILGSWDVLAYIPTSFCRSFTQWIQFPCSLWLLLRLPLGLSSLKHLAF